MRYSKLVIFMGGIFLGMSGTFAMNAAEGLEEARHQFLPSAPPLERKERGSNEAGPLYPADAVGDKEGPSLHAIILPAASAPPLEEERQLKEREGLREAFLRGRYDTIYALRREKDYRRKPYVTFYLMAIGCGKIPSFNRVAFEGELKREKGRQNPAAFVAEAYYLARNAYALEERLEQLGKVPGRGYALGKLLMARKRWKEAVLFFEEEGDGHAAALFKLAELYYHVSSLRDFARGRGALEGAAQAGHPKASYNLGINYFQGKYDYEKSRERGQAYIDRAMEGGSREAYYFMGKMNKVWLGRGKGSLEETARYFLEGLERGDKKSKAQVEWVVEELKRDIKEQYGHFNRQGLIDRIIRQAAIKPDLRSRLLVSIVDAGETLGLDTLGYVMHFMTNAAIEEHIKVGLGVGLLSHEERSVRGLLFSPTLLEVQERLFRRLLERRGEMRGVLLQTAREAILNHWISGALMKMGFYEALFSDERVSLDEKLKLGLHLMSEYEEWSVPRGLSEVCAVPRMEEVKRLMGLGDKERLKLLIGVMVQEAGDQKGLYIKALLKSLEKLEDERERRDQVRRFARGLSYFYTPRAIEEKIPGDLVVDETVISDPRVSIINEVMGAQERVVGDKEFDEVVKEILEDYSGLEERGLITDQMRFDGFYSEVGYERTYATVTLLGALKQIYPLIESEGERWHKFWSEEEKSVRERFWQENARENYSARESYLGSRKVLEKLLRYTGKNPDRFKRMIVEMRPHLESLDEQTRAAQLGAWAAAGFHCSTRAEDEVRSFYESHRRVNTTSGEDLQSFVAKHLAYKRGQILEGIVLRDDPEPSHQKLYLKKRLQRRLGLLGEFEGFEDRYGFVVRERYKQLTDEQLVRYVEETMTKGYVVDVIWEALRENQVNFQVVLKYVDRVGGKIEEVMPFDDNFMPTYTKEGVIRLLRSMGYLREKEVKLIEENHEAAIAELEEEGETY